MILKYKVKEKEVRVWLPEDLPFSEDVRITYGLTFLDGNYNFKVNINPVRLVDIGAYVGDTIVYFATKYDLTEVVAIEPNISLYTILMYNMYLNQIKNVVVEPKVVGRHKHVKLPFTTTPAIKHHEGELLRSYEAPTVVLEPFNTVNVRHGDLIKIDCEGCEKGLQVTCNGNGWVAVEVNDENYDFSRNIQCNSKLLEKRNFYNSYVYLYEVSPR